jgi:hypothetical protein
VVHGVSPFGLMEQSCRVEISAAITSEVSELRRVLVY